MDNIEFTGRIEDLLNEMDKLTNEIRREKCPSLEKTRMLSFLNGFIDDACVEMDICDCCYQKKEEVLFDDNLEVSCGCGTVVRRYKAI